MSRRLDGPQAEELHKAFGLLQAGRTTDALEVARRLSERAPLSPDAYQLLGMCEVRRGAFEAAEVAFRRALELAPDHPLILSNYAAALRQSGRPTAALALARRVAEASPGSAKAWTDLATTAQAAGNPGLALSAARRAQNLQPDSLVALQLSGNAARLLEDVDAAALAYSRILEREPAHRQAWLGLGDVQRRAGRPDLAIDTFEQAQRRVGHTPELADATVGALADAGRLEEAMQLAQSVNRQHPEFAPGWATTANLAWEYRPQEECNACLRAFADAVEAHPGNLSLHLAHARFLLSTGQPDEALSQIQAARVAYDVPSLLMMEAQALDALGETAAAGECYQRLERVGWSSEPAFLNAYARHLLQVRDYAAAATIASTATQIDPDNQQAWAWLATAWRMLGDPREEWLCNYQRLVGLVEIEPPAAFANREEFLSALADVLEPMHRARREPMQQSLRGGSQTPGRLFGRQDSLLGATRYALRRGIERWLATLPEDDTHPFLRRKRSSVRFGGSWSVKLWSSGLHVNHIHSEGWMSSAFYVAVPPSVVEAAGSAAPAGAIQFGQPPVELGLDAGPRRIATPHAGMLALFPSYLWHGTIPFQDEAPRMTIAFDMLPLAGNR
jgi:tetratricopeptide (TPR) repeat protein